MANEVSLEIGGNASLLMAELEKAKGATQAAAESMRTAFESVTGAFETLNVAMVGAMAVLGGGKIFGEMINASVDAAKGAIQLGRELGITATQASVLRVAMNENF